MAAGAAMPAIAAAGPGGGRRRHILDRDDFTAGEIGAVLDNAAAMRDVLARDIKVGKNIPTRRLELVRVRFTETDGVDDVSILERGGS